jgi:hypothetical protein
MREVRMGQKRAEVGGRLRRELEREESKPTCRRNTRTQGPSVLSFAWR